MSTLTSIPPSLAIGEAIVRSLAAKPPTDASEPILDLTLSGGVVDYDGCAWLPSRGGVAVAIGATLALLTTAFAGLVAVVPNPTAEQRMALVASEPPVPAPARVIPEAPKAPPSPMIEPPAIDAASLPDAPARDPSKGTIVLPAAADGHRIYVDGRLWTSSSSELALGCGRHVVKIGSLGRDQTVVVPCAGDVSIAYP